MSLLFWYLTAVISTAQQNQVIRLLFSDLIETGIAVCKKLVKLSGNTGNTGNTDTGEQGAHGKKRRKAASKRGPEPSARGLRQRGQERRSSFVGSLMPRDSMTL